MDIQELKQFEAVYQPSKEITYCWGVKKYVQLCLEQNHTDIVDHANDSLRIWQAAKVQVIPDGFVSVEDKLPTEGQDVIAFDAIKHCVFKGGEFLQGYIESDTGYEFEEPVEVTHWMTVET